MQSIKETRGTVNNYFKTGLLSIGALGSIAAILLLAGAAPAGAYASNICDPHTQLFNYTTSSVMTDPSDTARQDQALAWLKAMMEPYRTPGDGSSVTPSQAYPQNFTGTMTGTFSLHGTHPTVSTTPLTVTSPTELPDSYRGVVSGTATGTGPREVRAYLRTDSEYFQPSAIPAVVDAEGNWAINLAPVSASRAGAWHFRLYDTVTNTQIGESWPRPVTYENIVVQRLDVTDSPYVRSTQAANANNTWSFTVNSANGGEHMIRVVNQATNEILAEYYNPPTTGLIRSYEYLPGQVGYGTSMVQNSYMYDQALALLVAVGAQDKPMADELLRGLATVQVKTGEFTGAFPSGVEQLDPTTNNPSYYTGGNAVVLYALVRYLEAYGDQHGVRSMLDAGLAYIDTVYTATGPAAGLYRGGNEVSGGVTSTVNWHSTEHNTDLWHVFERAGRVLGDPAYTQKADNLAATILEKLWNTSENRFNQGFNDTARALDTTSWGAIFLAAVGEYEKADQSLAHAAAYTQVRGPIAGYTPYVRPNSIPTVWFEGTYGVALAEQTLGYTAEAQNTLTATYQGQHANGAYPYALEPDHANGRTDANSVASTAWFYLASASPTAMWSECRAVAVDPGEEVPGVPGGTNGTSGGGSPAQVPNTGIQTVQRMHLVLVSGIGIVLLLAAVFFYRRAVSRL